MRTQEGKTLNCSLMRPSAGNLHKLSGFPTHRNCEMINVNCFKLVANCYTMENQCSKLTKIVQANLSRSEDTRMEYRGMNVTL